jgi:hypothetical protein
MSAYPEHYTLVIVPKTECRQCHISSTAADSNRSDILLGLTATNREHLHGHVVFTSLLARVSWLSER